MRTATTTAKENRKEGERKSPPKKRSGATDRWLGSKEQQDKRRGRGEEKHIIVLFDESNGYLHMK
jgi:hypothetical protein